MNYRWKIIALILAIVAIGGWLCCGWLWIRPSEHVIAEARAPSGRAMIRVREMQLVPLSVEGVLGLDQKVYRCEYYPDPNWTMFTCETYRDEEYEVHKADIKWINDSAAKVTLDKGAAFECIDGNWHRSGR